MKLSFSKYRIWIVAAVVLGAILVVSQTSRRNADPFFRRQQLQKRQWNDAKIVPFLTHGGASGVVLAASDGKIDALPLSPEQRGALKHAVRDFVSVYSDGKFDSYRNSRIPAAVADHLRWNEKQMAMINRTVSTAKDYPLPDNLRDLFQSSNTNDNRSSLSCYWELMRYATNAHLGRPAYCHACWTGIDTNSVLAEIKYDKSPGHALVGFLERNENIGYAHFVPFLDYADLQPKETVPTLALLSLVVKTSLDDSPYRVFVAFEWYDAVGTWLPVEFALGRSDLEVEYVF